MMSTMTDDELLARLKTKIGATELYRVTTFKGYRKHPADGAVKEVTVEVWDAGSGGGPGGGQYRWTVQATDEDDRMATGNGAPTLEVAIDTTHWHELDS